jgi:hypothetical protein
MAKKYKGTFTIREASDNPRRGGRRTNSSAVVVVILLVVLGLFLYSRSHRSVAYAPQRANITR